MSPADLQWKQAPGRWVSQCKGPRVGTGGMTHAILDEGVIPRLRTPVNQDGGGGGSLLKLLWKNMMSRLTVNLDVPGNNGRSNQGKQSS